MNKAYLIVLLILSLSGALPAQDTIRYQQNRNEFEAVFNDSDYTSSLVISSGGKHFYRDSFDRVSSIAGYNLSGGEEKDIIIETYTGGAHCCTMLYIGKLKDRSFNITDTIYLGNSGFEVKDIDGDGKYEIECVWDGFAYAFTAYAFSRFPLVIYGYRDGKLSAVTGEYRQLVNDEIESFKADLKGTGFYKCPENEEDSFSSGAGETKAILAAILYDYVTLGEGEKGYRLIDETYNCPDKGKFVEELQNTYKLK
jgi:hypothetical protein